MIIGDRIREFRIAKRLSQKDMQDRTGLLRGYLSRVENGHTIPSIETLEKFAGALEIPLYQLFYDSANATTVPDLPGQRLPKEILWGSSGKDAHYLSALRRHLGLMGEANRLLFLSVAQKIGMRRKRASKLTAQEQSVQTS
jgi:transcriptional regulator with XRE-family HTH domain